MKRNCSLELRLSSSPPNDSMNEPLNLNQQVDIPQNGGHFMFDTTELQARGIIWLASKEMEERIGVSGTTTISSLISLQSPQGLSMKRSLQTFLQNRRKRTQS
ncbi:hypothetical protein L6164_028876 [Bauhinia variegata]|uniref:Uncharacterized protein n=1 Tax=Bauhinia variegata TaxID=167791 RepID=A0ACB9L7I1_BAUVA|nr:hypothetical protein L6164_028876 [Bauhinia variegata]